MREFFDLVKRLVRRRAATLRLFMTGFSMGSADLVPGVSGGTMALLFGIYEELIHSIRIVSSKVPRLVLQGEIRNAVSAVPWAFLVPVGAGMMVALFSLAQLLSHLLDNHPVFVWSFFFGLVAASVWIVGRRVGHWDMKAYGMLAVGAVATYVLVGAVPVETSTALPVFFVSGMIAIVAMILPGISGSFILVLIGKYTQVLDLVTSRDLITLGVFTLGAVVGLALFSRVLSYMFQHHHTTLMAFLTGVLLGSLRKVWPWKETVEMGLDRHGNEVPLVEANRLPAAFDGELALAVGLLVMAVVLIVYLSRHEVSKEQVRKDIDGSPA
ncbi:MAG: DUF368 domain-containing protein [Anaerolineae bacterium]|nr:DUF368 domain-containing protein [Anaerolineae bacterium]